MVPAAREVFSSISPARSGWIVPGRIGFMSTQRRENRSTQATKSFRGGRRLISTPEAITSQRDFLSVLRPSGRLERDGYKLIPVARFIELRSSGMAAQPVDLAFFHNEKWISLGTPAATSLQSDSSTPLVRLVPRGTCRGWSPRRAERHDTRPLRIRLTSLPNLSPFPAPHVSILPCRGYRLP